MADTDRHLTREELINAMEVNWGRYLATFNLLTEEDQRRFSQEQGFDNPKDLFVYLTAWFGRALDQVRAARGVPLPENHADLASYRTDAANRHADRTLEQVQDDFQSMHTAFAGEIGELPNDTFADPQTYDLLVNTAVTFYLDYQPPGEPQAPAEQYGGNRPTPGT